MIQPDLSLSKSAPQEMSSPLPGRGERVPLSDAHPPTPPWGRNVSSPPSLHAPLHTPYSVKVVPKVARSGYT